jgi:hypothetical protein
MEKYILVKEKNKSKWKIMHKGMRKKGKSDEVCRRG